MKDYPTEARPHEGSLIAFFFVRQMDRIPYSFSMKSQRTLKTTRPLTRLVLSVIMALVAGVSVLGADLVSAPDSTIHLDAENQHEMGWAQLLGPLAPVALSPFFGITCLSGAAMLMDQGLLPGNAFIQNNDLLRQPSVFITFLILTLATSLPRFSKVSKPLAQALDHVEAYAGVITMLVLQYVAQHPAPGGVATAGILLGLPEFLLMVVAAVNMLVIHTVRFFFETLVLVSPVPLIDALFESANKLACAGLILLYSLNPAIAMVANILIFFGCLVLVRWCHRKTVYYRHLLLDPFTARLRAFLGSTRPPSFRIEDAPRPVAGKAVGATFVLPVFPDHSIGDIPKHARCYLLRYPDHWSLLQPRWFGRSCRETLTGMTNPQIENTWTSNVIIGSPADPALRLLFSNRYQELLPEIAEHSGIPINDSDALGDRLSSSLAELGRRIAGS